MSATRIGQHTSHSIELTTENPIIFVPLLNLFVANSTRNYDCDYDAKHIDLNRVCIFFGRDIRPN